MLVEDKPAEIRNIALASYAVLDTVPERAFDAMAEFAAAICAAPIGAISFLAETRQWFKASVGAHLCETPLSASFCAHAIGQDGVFTVRDATEHPLFAHTELVTGPFGLRFYAGARICAADGTPIGALCVIDIEARPEGLTASQEAALLALARQVETNLELRRTMAAERVRIEEQERLTAELSRIASHDALTGLANRDLFLDGVDIACRRARQTGDHAAVILIDGDNFKLVNDTWGHDAGDAVLIAFADRLRATVRSTDLVARLGGDEFAVLLPCGASTQTVSRIARNIVTELSQPIAYAGRSIDCRASVGYAVIPEHAFTAKELMKSADLALGDAKASGRSCSKPFRPQLWKVFNREISMLDQARRALRDGSIEPHYQPKIDLRTGQIVGAEALLRWKTGDGEMEMPSSIAAALDHRELAIAITDRILDRVLFDLRRWQADGVQLGHVGINTSSVDFLTNDFAERLLEKLDHFGVSPTAIEIEVTESVLLGRGRHQVHRALGLLRRSGMGISLDDFGTGHASLTHLRDLPITALKIDRSFISGLGRTKDDSIVEVLALLGKRLGLQTVAEGIETARQQAQVTEFGVSLGQGYRFSPAIPSAEFRALLDVPRLWPRGRRGTLAGVFSSSNRKRPAGLAIPSIGPGGRIGTTGRENLWISPPTGS